MFLYGKIRAALNSNRISSGIFQESFSLISGFISGSSDSRKKELLRRAFQSLVLPMLQSNGRISESKKNVYRHLLEEQFDRANAENHLAELTAIDPMAENDATAFLLENDPVNAQKSAAFLLALAVALDESPENIALAQRFSAAVGFPAPEFAALHQKLSDENARKKRLIRSGHGVIAALVIIGIFILTAKLLQSVIFGLILGCILLPVEKFFERRLRSKRGICFAITAFFGGIMTPLRRLSHAITRKGNEPASPDTAEKLRERRIIHQAISLTALAALLVTCGICFGVANLTGKYMEDVQKKVQVWERSQQVNSLKKNDNSLQHKVNFYLDQMRERFEKLPPVRAGLDFLGNIINNPEVRTRFVTAILQHSGGIFSFTTGMVGMFISLCCNILLTIFFALLFLLKMAEFCRNDNSDKSKSEYLVRTFFNGIWLPDADENVIQEACRIIEGIFFRLRVWLKGYLTLILVDSTVYTTCFFFLGVPFFLPLGVLAGCGIALPYLGPVISCAVTVLVTIAAGAASGHMLLAIIICYLIYNGIIEQFILYPAVIGESLGLSTLETIIVVLLGAVFAGIPGMIFALPAASVAKYIVPQIYRGLIRERNV